MRRENGVEGDEEMDGVGGWMDGERMMAVR